MISTDSVVETPEQLRHLVQVAMSDVREDPTPLVAALAYGGVCRAGEDRIRLGIDLLELPQLTSSELKTLSTTIGFSNVPEPEVTIFLDALLDHPAMSTDVVVALFHSHTTDIAAHSPALCNPGDLAVAVARATAGKEVVRSRSALRFIEHVSASASDGVCQQLAYLLDAGEWSASLWEAYEAAAGIQDETPVRGVDLPEWFDPLEPTAAA